MSNIAIFVDVQNIYYTTRSVFARQFNYRKFFKDIATSNTIISATAYAIDKGDNRQEKFQSALKHIGFNVKLKPFIQRSDGTAKGDWDVGITIDIMEEAPKVDKIVLLSGDGDFSILLNKIRDKYNTKSIIYSVEQLTAKSLIDSSDNFHRITNEDLI